MSWNRVGSAELRVCSVMGSGDVLSVHGEIDKSNFNDTLEQLEERLKSRGRSFVNARLDLANKDLHPTELGAFMTLFADNHVKPHSIALAGNRIGDFDMHACFSALSRGALDCVREIDLSRNRIGDFGCVCLLQILLNAKLQSDDHRSMTAITVHMGENVVSHPSRLLSQIPRNLIPYVFAQSFPGETQPAPSSSTLVRIVGLEKQLCVRAANDRSPTPVSGIVRGCGSSTTASSGMSNREGQYREIDSNDDW